MAKRKRKTQAPDLDQIFTDDAEEMEDDASALEAETLEQEEAAEEEEDNLDEEAEEDDEDGTDEDEEEGAEAEAPVPEWRYLTDAQRNEKKKGVREWLKQPNRENVQQRVNDLVDLVVDTLVQYAYQRSYQPCQNAVTAASSARVCCNELLALVRQDQDATWETLKGTMEWWLENRRGRGSGDLDFPLERCADQVAAVLVFKNLPPTEDMRGQQWWGVLLHRVITQIILPRLREPVSEDRVSDCIEAILAGAQQFTYQGLGQAVNFFTEACRLVILRLCPTQPPPSPPDTANQALSVRRERVWQRLTQMFERKDAIKVWILLMLKEDRNLEWNAISGKLPFSLEAFQVDLDSGNFSGGLRQAFESHGISLSENVTISIQQEGSNWLITDHDLKKTYSVRKENNQLNSYASMVLQPFCDILSDDDLPPGVTWDEVYNAFQMMALNEEALRKFYSRAKRKLCQYAQDHPQADPRQ